MRHAGVHFAARVQRTFRAHTERPPRVQPWRPLTITEATGGPLIMATHITRRAITSSVMAGAAAIPASSLPAVALTSKIIRCGNRQGRLYGSVCHRTWYPDGD